MGKMKTLYTLLQEAEQALQEQDPLAYEHAKKVIEAVQAMTLASLARPRENRPAQDQTPPSL
jgi:hypothetical protein